MPSKKVSDPELIIKDVKPVNQIEKKSNFLISKLEKGILSKVETR